MVIYVFTEHYPSPFKPYFDCQFEQFLRDGHRLVIFALGRQGGEVEPRIAALGLDRMTSYLPATLRNVAACGGAIVRRALRSPVRSAALIGRVAGVSGSPKLALLNAARAAILPETPPDFCLVHSLTTATRVAFLRQLYPGVPVALYYHGGEVAGVPQISNAQARPAFDGADIVFTNTENSKAHAAGRGCDPAKIVVSPVGFSIPDFRTAEPRTYRRDGVFNLLSIGRFSEEKGFRFALDAVRQLLQRGVTGFRYRFIGGGPLLAEMRSFVAGHGLGEHVIFLGQLTREELYEQVRTADTLVLPSIVLGTWQENQACVLQEAMLMKTPAIATRAGGIPESIAPELQRFSVPPEDATALAEAMAAVMALDASSLADLGRACRRFAEVKYDIASLNRQIIDAVEPLRRRASVLSA